jgi:hypothetical protein
MCYTVAVAREVQERDVSAGGEQPLHMRDQFVALDAVATSCVEGLTREVDRVVLSCKALTPSRWAWCVPILDPYTQQRRLARARSSFPFTQSSSVPGDAIS